jgi:uncharacterized protein YcbK (DUF882 family)
MGDLSPHFSKSEMACRCCGELNIKMRLVDALEKLRNLAGRAIVIHDGYRCRAHNQEVGGVTDSEHVLGMAADVEIPGLSLQEMYELALQVPEFVHGGVGVYDGGFLHVDVRLHASRWARVKGQYVGIQTLIKDPILLAKVQTTSQSG